jgi:hypothetical protein
MGFVSLAVYRDRAHKRTLTMGGFGFLVFWFLVVGFSVFGFWFLVFGFWFLVFGFWFRVFTFRDQNPITCYIGRYRPPYLFSNQQNFEYNVVFFFFPIPACRCLIFYLLWHWANAASSGVLPVLGNQEILCRFHLQRHHPFSNQQNL